jgi:hypothetical protein
MKGKGSSLRGPLPFHNSSYPLDAYGKAKTISRAFRLAWRVLK